MPVLFRPTSDDLRRLLKPTATTSERVRGLLSVGLHASDVARCTGVSVSALRNWGTGQAEPRADAAIALDDLRAATKVLLDGGLEPERAARWLTSRDPDRFADKRPLELLHDTPTAVLTAAHNEVLETQIAAVTSGAEAAELARAGR